MFGLSITSTPARSAVPMSGSSAPSTSTGSAGSAGYMFGLSAPFAFAGFVIPVLSLSTLSASALFVSTGSAMPVLGLSAPSASAPSTSVLFASFGSTVPMPGLSASATPVFGSSTFSTLVVTPTLGKQKLIELNQREKKATLEELAPAFTLLLPSKPPLLFSANYVSKKRLFDKAFNINCQPLANNQFGKDIDQSFAGCQYLLAVKTNKM